VANEFKVGQIVQIIGDYSDFTDHLDGQIGIIKNVTKLDCVVTLVGDSVEWLVWKHNLVPIGHVST
jgi:hypothetical protein